MKYALYVVTRDGITVTKRVHAVVLVCVKTATILGAVLSLGPLKEEALFRWMTRVLPVHLVSLPAVSPTAQPNLHQRAPVLPIVNLAAPEQR